jgi:hypothetical protein
VKQSHCSRRRHISCRSWDAPFPRQQTSSQPCGRRLCDHSLPGDFLFDRRNSKTAVSGDRSRPGSIRAARSDRPPRRHARRRSVAVIGLSTCFDRNDEQQPLGLLRSQSIPRYDSCTGPARDAALAETPSPAPNLAGVSCCAEPTRLGQTQTCRTASQDVSNVVARGNRPTLLLRNRRLPPRCSRAILTANASDRACRSNHRPRLVSWHDLEWQPFPGDS